MEPTNRRPPRSIDPDPVSLSLSLFAAISSGLSAAIKWREHRHGVKRDRDRAREKLFAADRALNRLDEAYRSLISIFEQEGVLAGPVTFLPGHGELLVDSRLRAEVDRVHRAAFDAGRQLERSLDELGPFLSDAEALRASDLVYAAEQGFRETQHAEEIHEFLVGVGRLIYHLSEFVEDVGATLDVQLPSTRLALLEETLARLGRSPNSA